MLLRQGEAPVGQHLDKAYEALLLIFLATSQYHPGRQARGLPFAVAQRSSAVYCATSCGRLKCSRLKSCNR